MSQSVIPLSLKDAPALIERLLPVQKLSAESFKEQEARQSKTLTALGSYWKGRNPHERVPCSSTDIFVQAWLTASVSNGGAYSIRRKPVRRISSRPGKDRMGNER